jgi:hypothetical protein
MTHIEFADITTLLDRNFWNSSGLFTCGHRLRSGRRLWLSVFVGFVALLCIACSLMGPAAAVLVIPSLGWSEIKSPGAQKFGQMAASDPPGNRDIAFACETSYLAAGNFTCTGDDYSLSLDEQSSGILARFRDFETGFDFAPGISEYWGLSFAFNLSKNTSSSIVWFPNRQVLREVSDDYYEFGLTQGNMTFDDANSNLTDTLNRTLDRHLYDSYRNNLDVVLHRTGPSIGLKMFCARATITDLTLSSQKSVRCYDLISFEYEEIDCIRIGSDWNEEGFSHSEFSIGDADLGSAGDVSVDVYSVTRAILLNDTTLPCLSADQSSEPCDWDLLFSTDPDRNVSQYSFSQQYIEYSVPLLSPPNAASTIVCSNLAYLAFIDYAIDVSPSVNSFSGVTLNVPGDDPINNSILLHSDWTLAAWSVIRSGTVDGDRAAAVNLVSTLKDVANTSVTATGYDDVEMNLFSSQHIITSLHAASLVDFSTTDPSESSAGKPDDPLHPLLTVSKTLRVWAYGHTSRTFKLGTAVALFGCFCVALRLVIGLFSPPQRSSTVELMAAALMYTYQGDFDNQHKESTLGRVPFKMSWDSRGKVAFAPRRSWEMSSGLYHNLGSS